MDPAGSCFKCIALSTCYTSIQSKNIVLYLKCRDFLILAKVSKKLKNIFFPNFVKLLLYLKKIYVSGEYLNGFPVDFTIFVAVWAETDRFFFSKYAKNVCETKCAKLPIFNA